MAEFRQNFITKEWVIVAEERAQRPADFPEQQAPKPAVPAFREDCPFCAGHEDMTPGPVHVIEASGSWRVRVVPNKFAPLDPGDPGSRRMHGPFLAAGGHGIAEVVIETPHHDRGPDAQPVDGVRDMLRAYRARHLYLAAVPSVNLVTIFRNCGPAAGTSLEHPHSQIIATPIVPPHVREPWRHALFHYDTNGRCAYCEMIEGELSERVRIVRETEHFVALCPFASRSPYETRIFPKRHHAAFSWINDREMDDLAGLLKDTLRRIRRRLSAPDYNYFIRSAASGDEDVRFLHWYLAITPRVTTAAGFEIGSGIYINVTSPERAAEHLRQVEFTREER